MLAGFALLGIGNTIVQVSANPLLVDVVPGNRTSSFFSFSQFVKAIGSMIGASLAAVLAAWFGDWKLLFLVFGVFSILSARYTSSGAMAYFSNDGSLFLFHHYDGPKDTLLYYFYMAAFKVQLGFYKDLEITDSFPLNLIIKNPLLFIQDFVAPFYKFLRSEYKIKYEYIDNDVFTTKIKLVSSATNYLLGRKLKSTIFALEIDENGIYSFEVNTNKEKITARLCTDH